MPRATATRAAEAPEKAAGAVYTVKVTANPDFCGIGACGLHFAHGEAKTTSERAAAWFREHDGYTVE